MTDQAAPYQVHPQEDMETPPPNSGAGGSYVDQYSQDNPSPSQTNSSDQPPVTNPTTAAATDATNAALFPGVEKPIPEEVVLEWNALSRPFKKRTRQYFTTVAILVLLVSLILFFAGQFLPIAVVISVGFLAYVLSVVPPAMVKHSLTTYGIRIEGNLYYWEELGRFWFTQKFGDALLHIEVARFPGRLTILLGDIPEGEMKEILSEVLLFQKPAPTFFEKAAEWIEQKIPLDGPPPTATAKTTTSVSNDAQTPSATPQS